MSLPEKPFSAYHVNPGLLACLCGSVFIGGEKPQCEGGPQNGTDEHRSI